MSEKKQPGAKHILKSKVYKNVVGSKHFLRFRFQMSFRKAGTRDSVPSQKRAKCEGLVAISTTTGYNGHYHTLDYTLLYPTLHYTPLHYTTPH